MKKWILFGLALWLSPIPAFCLDYDWTADAIPLENTVALNDDTTTTALPPSAAATAGGTDRKSLPDNNRISNGVLLSIPEQRDPAGLWLDTKLFLLYQVGVVAVLYVSPESVSKWSTQQKNGNPFRKWSDNVRALRTDHDRWEVNYIGHPYFGAVYYTRARNRGFSRAQSLGYAAMMSSLYEYGIEAIFEPASVQDLIFTPVGGAVLGEYFMIGRQKILNKIEATGEKTWLDSVGLFFTDPLGAINTSVLHTFGKKAELNVLPTIIPASANPASHTRNIGVVGLLQW